MTKTLNNFFVIIEGYIWKKDVKNKYSRSLIIA